MKLAVSAIGLLKSGPETELAVDYQKRLSGIGRTAGMTDMLIREFPESRAATDSLRKLEEQKLLWATVPDGTTSVALDERGKAMNSQEFAVLLKRLAESGTKQTTFLIGGPDGHAPETRSKASQIISFGPMTFPHRLLRVMLLEQIYRAVTILVNHPYHRA
jgi:23S rRNA (pseudouridine1915-N3)-methyltransferase